MPDSAHVTGQLTCPACGQLQSESLRYQWGALPGGRYAVGDAVEWLRDSGGAIVPPYVLIDVGHGRHRWNCGDPLAANVILFDIDLYPNDGLIECTGCHACIAAEVAVVCDGVFRELRALDDSQMNRILGLSRGKANIVIVRDDGSYWPREDWYDKTITYRPHPAPELAPSSSSVSE